ncbi:MAG: TolC family protein [Planctomycetes bacterium]|nr:TolC family protein [Planctomycetota bacterium]
MQARSQRIKKVVCVARSLGWPAVLAAGMTATAALAEQPFSPDRGGRNEDSYSTRELSIPSAPLAEATPGVAVEEVPIDLPTALRLAGAQNQIITVAYARTLQTTAVQQLAATQLLPNLNLGTNYDAHSGALMQASGNVLDVTRNALFVGAGANAVAAGSVGIPGVQFNQNASEMIFRMIAARPLVQSSRYAYRATSNNLQLDVALAYGELLRAEGGRAIAQQVRGEAVEIARVTSDYARAGQGRDAEAARGANELARREADLVQANAEVAIASAQLVALLNMQSSVRLHAAEPWVVPRSIIPDPIELPELLAMALYRRPELGQFRAAVEMAMANLQGARVLPFSPQVMAGYSYGVYGGGSGLVASADQPRFNAPLNGPRFGNFASRGDFDVIMYWSLRNLGVGNHALIQGARARLGQTQMERLIVLNQVQVEVATTYARKTSSLAQVNIRQRAVETSAMSLKEDMLRVRNNEGRPIEVLDSLRLLSDARREYLNAIVDYNQAHFALFTAVGQPPADLLVRPTVAQPPAPPADRIAP